MSKKLLSVVLALALALSCFAVSAFALGSIGYESEEDAAYYTQAWALESSNNGNTYTVDVVLTANYKVGPIQFKVLKTVTAGSIALTGADTGADIPDDWYADVSFDDATGEVAVIPNPEEDGVNALDATDGVVVATLTYTVSDDAAGKLVIDVADVKSEANPGGTLIAARMSDGNVVTGTAITGQTVDADTNAITIGAAATPPTLVAIDGTIGVVDTSRTDLNADGDQVTGYIYGVEPENGETIDAVFEVVGDGTMNIVANDEGSDCGTGTIVEVLDLDGNVVESYVLIIFGDVTGDGAIYEEDGTNILLHDAWSYGDTGRFESPVILFAGDVTCDGEIYEEDGTNVLLHDAWSYGDGGRLLQADVIAML